MATLLRTLLGRARSDEISRYDLTQYIRDLQNAQLAYPSSVSTTSRGGRPAEDIENSFTGYTYQAYKRNGVIFAIILSRLLLFTEARFGFRAAGGKLDTTAAGLDVLRRPWPNGTTGELLARMEQDVSLSGNFYAVNEGDRLRRLRPDWVSIILSAPPEEALASDVIGYQYSPGGHGGGEAEYFLPDEVCHWSPIPDPTAQYRGMSWLTPVIQEITADGLATTHKRKFFEQGATPQVIVKVPEGLTPAQFREYITESNRVTSGTNNAYKTWYIGGGADATVVGANLQQLDFKATQGAGETRLCAAGAVPPIIVGLSEGLSSATYSNYGMARRKFGDHWARPSWRSACAALSVLVAVPDGEELWYDDSGIAFLREDMKDAAEIQQILASTINSFVTAGFTKPSAIAAVEANDRTLLVDTGLVSVQLLPPGQEPGHGTSPASAGAEPDPVPADPPSAVRSAAGFEGPDDNEPDELTYALLVAIAELADDDLARAFNPGLHKRYPKGHPKGGQFRPMVDLLKTALEEHLKGDAKGDPFELFSRDQLRRVARSRGLTLKRGSSRDDIAAQLLGDLKGKVSPGKAVPSRKSASAKPLTMQAALDAAPARLIRAPEGHHGNYDGEDIVGPAGMGSVRALSEYEGPEYQATNSYLRLGPSDVEKHEPGSVWREVAEANNAENAGRVAEIDKTMSVSRLTAPVQVERIIKEGKQVFGEQAWYGNIIDWDDWDHGTDQWEAGERPDLTGARWHDAGYVSTTADPKVAEEFGGRWRNTNSGLDGEPVIMKIQVPAGVGGVQLAEMGHAAEILLERGLTYEVVADHGVDDDGFRRIDVKVVTE